MNFSHGFLWRSPRFFVPLQNISRNVLLVNAFSKHSSFIMFNDQCTIIQGPYGARPTVFPQHSATFGLAQIQESVARISRAFGVGAAAQTNVSTMRGQYYLPTLGASLRCPIFDVAVRFLSLSKNAQGLLGVNSDFTPSKNPL